MAKRDLESSIPPPENDLKGKQRLSQQQYQPHEGDQYSVNAGSGTTAKTYAGIFGANDPVVPSELPAPTVKPLTVPSDSRGTTPVVSEQNAAAQSAFRQPGTDQRTAGTSADGSLIKTAPIARTPNSDGAALSGGVDQRRVADLSSGAAPGVSELKPFVAPGNRSGESVGVANPERNPIVKASDTGTVRAPVDTQSASASGRTAVIAYTTNDDNQVRVSRQPLKAPETVPAVQNVASERPVPSANLAPDGGQQKPFVAPDAQPRTNLSGEQSAEQTQTRSVAPERVDVSAVAPKGNTGSVEAANITRPNVGSAESQNQFKPTNVVGDAQNRTTPGVSPDAGNRELGGRDGLARTTGSGSVLDLQGKQLTAGAERTPLGLDNKQTSSEAAGARVTGPQTSADASAKPGVGNAANDFGTRREGGVQLPDTKQTTGRTDSGVQLPDTKQSSGRTDTGGTRMPDTRNDTGRNDANTGKLPDAKTLANLDQKFGDKVNPPGKGGGVPIAMPGIPDILGGLRTDKDSKTVKDAKADSQGSRDGAVRGEAPGRDAKDGKGESQASKDSKVADGRGDTKTGADDRSASGQKGIRSEADGATKGSDGKTAPDVRGTAQDGRTGADGKSADGRSQGGSNLVHDGGTKSDGAHSGRADGGTKSDGAHGGRADGADRGTDKGGSDKGLGERGSGEKGAGADKGLGDGKTRVDQPAARVVDADGKLIGGKSETGSSIRTDLGDKGHGDGSVGGKPVGTRGDAPFVLPPGSLPVPDLVGGIKNVGQQIDGRTGKSIPIDDKGLRQSDKVEGTKADAGKLDPGKVIGGKTDVGKTDPTKADGVKPDAKGTIGDGVKTIVTGGVLGGDGAKSIRTGGATGGDGVKTTVTGGVAGGDGVKTAVTGGAGGDGVKTAVTGGAKVGEGVKIVGASDNATDGKQIVGTKADGAIIMPPSAVPLTEMIGNLKGIAARIFPPESRTGHPGAFDNSLPGRKTEKLEDRTQSSLGAGVRTESTIPIIRAIGERIGKSDEQFVIKLPQTAIDANKNRQSKVEATVHLPPWIATEHAVSDKSVTGSKVADANATNSSTAKSTDAKFTDSKSTDAKPSIKNEVQQSAPKAGDQQGPNVDKHEQVHDEAAERLLVNLELVGSPDSVPASESDEEEVFPLAAIEYFGGEFEKAISDEEDVAFDGDGAVADDDEQSTRYQYIVEAGDTVELISIKVFKNVALAPLIYEINKEAIPIGMQDGRMVFTLKVGTVIWLPFPKEVKAYMQT